MKRLVPALLASALIGGCSAADLPLPGGAPSGPSYRIIAEFADVLDLVPQSAVKVNDVTVGTVERISLAGWTARAHLRIGRQVRLPANATAAVRQSSLLGEKYVALTAPDQFNRPMPSGRKDPPSGEGELADGAVIPLSRTRRAAEVEEVLAALGLLLNGGGLAQLKTINSELATALERDTAKGALHQLDEFVGGLDQQKADLVRAIEALDRLTGRLAQQRDVLGTALDALGPGLTVLAEQREQLTTALTALGELGAVGARVVNASRDDTLASIRALQPILEQLVQAGDALPKSLDFLLTFPFPPNVTGAIVGDFVNLHVTADIDAAAILSNLLVATAPAAPLPGSSGRPPARGGTGPRPPGVPGLPSLPGVLPIGCLPVGGILPPGWVPPSGCQLPSGCRLIPPGMLPPPGSIIPIGGIVPPGTVFPPGTLLPPGTALTLQCLLPPATGAVSGQSGGLPNVLSGGLRP
jgi:phospholipid/cholesterol/gamma-HCH transport system substrate-binding protein